MPNWFSEFIAFSCAAGAVLLLAALSLIDLRVRLLPNKLVAPFAVLGVVFHCAMHWSFVPPLSEAGGALLGGGLLYGIRMVANKIYQQDTLGLGDVKLMAAAGLWLGVDGVLAALTLGAFCGLLHGLGAGLWQARRTKSALNLSRLEVPAGPGFAIGIVMAAIYQYLQLRHS